MGSVRSLRSRLDRIEARLRPEAAPLRVSIYDDDSPEVVAAKEQEIADHERLYPNSARLVCHFPSRA